MQRAPFPLLNTGLPCQRARAIQDSAADTLSGFVPPLPPEPLRWLIIRGVSGALDWYDSRIDRELRTMSHAKPPG